MIFCSGRVSPLKRLLRGGALLLVSGVALATQPQGEWKGPVQQANTDVAAVLRFRPDVVEVHFGEPFACHVKADLLKEAGAATIYRFGASKNGGGFCDGLLGRDLKVAPGPDGRLSIDFPSAKTAWHGDLRQAATASTQP